MQTSPPLLPRRPQSDWWSRNWKWFVPLVMLVGVAGIAGFVFGIAAIMKTSDAYRGAVRLSRSNPAVIAAIGTPIAEGLFVSGTVNVSGSSGKADLAIPISGPKGSATVYADATKALGEWRFDHLIVQVEQTHERIEIIESQTPNQSSKPTTKAGTP